MDFKARDHSNKHEGFKDGSFYARRIPSPTFIHLMPTRTSRFTKIRHKIIFVNRLTFFVDRFSPNVINGIEHIHFIGIPITSFPKGTTVKEVVNYFIKKSDLAPKENPQILSFYHFMVRESVVNAAKVITNFKDIREACHNMNFAVDVTKGLKYYTLVNILRLKCLNLLAGFEKWTHQLPDDGRAPITRDINMIEWEPLVKTPRRR